MGPLPGTEAELELAIAEADVKSLHEELREDEIFRLAPVRKQEMRDRKKARLAFRMVKVFLKLDSDIKDRIMKKARLHGFGELPKVAATPEQMRIRGIAQGTRKCERHPDESRLLAERIATYADASDLLAVLEIRHTADNGTDALNEADALEAFRLWILEELDSGEIKDTELGRKSIEKLEQLVDPEGFARYAYTGKDPSANKRTKWTRPSPAGDLAIPTAASEFYPQHYGNHPFESGGANSEFPEYPAGWTGKKWLSLTPAEKLGRGFGCAGDKDEILFGDVCVNIGDVPYMTVLDHMRPPVGSPLLTMSKGAHLFKYPATIYKFLKTVCRIAIKNDREFNTILGDNFIGDFFNPNEEYKGYANWTESRSSECVELECEQRYLGYCKMDTESNHNVSFSDRTRLLKMLFYANLIRADNDKCNEIDVHGTRKNFDDFLASQSLESFKSFKFIYDAIAKFVPTDKSEYSNVLIDLYESFYCIMTHVDNDFTGTLSNPERLLRILNMPTDTDATRMGLWGVFTHRIKHGSKRDRMKLRSKMRKYVLELESDPEDSYMCRKLPEGDRPKATAVEALQSSGAFEDAYDVIKTMQNEDVINIERELDKLVHDGFFIAHPEYILQFWALHSAKDWTFYAAKGVPPLPSVAGKVASNVANLRNVATVVGASMGAVAVGVPVAAAVVGASMGVGAASVGSAVVGTAPLTSAVGKVASLTNATVSSMVGAANYLNPFPRLNLEAQVFSDKVNESQIARVINATVNLEDAPGQDGKGQKIEKDAAVRRKRLQRDSARNKKKALAPLHVAISQYNRLVSPNYTYRHNSYTQVQLYSNVLYMSLNMSQIYFVARQYLESVCDNAHAKKLVNTFSDIYSRSTAQSAPNNHSDFAKRCLQEAKYFYRLDYVMANLGIGQTSSSTGDWIPVLVTGGTGAYDVAEAILASLEVDLDRSYVDDADGDAHKLKFEFIDSERRDTLLKQLVNQIQALDRGEQPNSDDVQLRDLLVSESQTAVAHHIRVRSPFRAMRRMVEEKAVFTQSSVPDFITEMVELFGTRCILSTVEKFADIGIKMQSRNLPTVDDSGGSPILVIGGQNQIPATACIQLLKSTMANDAKIMMHANFVRGGGDPTSDWIRAGQNIDGTGGLGSGYVECDMLIAFLKNFETMANREGVPPYTTQWRLSTGFLNFLSTDGADGLPRSAASLSLGGRKLVVYLSVFGPISVHTTNISTIIQDAFPEWARGVAEKYDTEYLAESNSQCVAGEERSFEYVSEMRGMCPSNYNVDSVVGCCVSNGLNAARPTMYARGAYGLPDVARWYAKHEFSNERKFLLSVSSSLELSEITLCAFSYAYSLQGNLSITAMRRAIAFGMFIGKKTTVATRVVMDLITSLASAAYKTTSAAASVVSAAVRPEAGYGTLKVEAIGAGDGSAKAIEAGDADDLTVRAGETIEMARDRILVNAKGGAKSAMEEINNAQATLHSTAGEHWEHANAVYTMKRKELMKVISDGGDLARILEMITETGMGLFETKVRETMGILLGGRNQKAYFEDAMGVWNLENKDRQHSEAEDLRKLLGELYKGAWGKINTMTQFTFCIIMWLVRHPVVHALFLEQLLSLKKTICERVSTFAARKREESGSDPWWLFTSGPQGTQGSQGEADEALIRGLQKLLDVEDPEVQTPLLRPGESGAASAMRKAIAALNTDTSKKTDAERKADRDELIQNVREALRENDVQIIAFDAICREVQEAEGWGNRVRGKALQRTSGFFPETFEDERRTGREMGYVLSTLCDDSFVKSFLDKYNQMKYGTSAVMQTCMLGFGGNVIDNVLNLLGTCVIFSIKTSVHTTMRQMRIIHNVELLKNVITLPCLTTVEVTAIALGRVIDGPQSFDLRGNRTSVHGSLPDHIVADAKRMGAHAMLYSLIVRMLMCGDLGNPNEEDNLRTGIRIFNAVCDSERALRDFIDHADPSSRADAAFVAGGMGGAAVAGAALAIQAGSVATGAATAPVTVPAALVVGSVALTAAFLARFAEEHYQLPSTAYKAVSNIVEESAKDGGLMAIENLAVLVWSAMDQGRCINLVDDKGIYIFNVASKFAKDKDEDGRDVSSTKAWVGEYWPKYVIMWSKLAGGENTRLAYLAFQNRIDEKAENCMKVSEIKTHSDLNEVGKWNTLNPLQRFIIYSKLNNDNAWRKVVEDQAETYISLLENYAAWKTDPKNQGMVASIDAYKKHLTVNTVLENSKDYVESFSQMSTNVVKALRESAN